MTVMVSLWRNDEARRLEDRVAHLLSKRAEGGLRWRWVIGDSSDGTEAALRRLATHSVEILRHDTGIEGEETQVRRLRMAATATAAFAGLDGDDFVCLHESDLQSPIDVVDQLMAGPTPAAGMVFLKLARGEVFYDVYAYRANGRRFEGSRPYHEVYNPSKLFEVDSFGSCWIAPAALVSGRRLDARCVVDLCGQWRAEGVRLWVNPRIRIEQPVDLWIPTTGVEP